MCTQVHILSLGLHSSNNINQINSTWRQAIIPESIISFFFLKNKRWKEKQRNANWHSRNLCLRCREMIQEQLKAFCKCLFINPVGGVTPSGTPVQRKTDCSGSILNSKQVYFLPLKNYMHKTTRTNVCIRHTRTFKTREWDPTLDLTEASFHHE